MAAAIPLQSVDDYHTFLPVTPARTPLIVPAGVGCCGHPPRRQPANHEAGGRVHGQLSALHFWGDVRAAADSHAHVLLHFQGGTALQRLFSTGLACIEDETVSLHLATIVRWLGTRASPTVHHDAGLLHYANAVEWLAQALFAAEAAPAVDGAPSALLSRLVDAAAAVACGPLAADLLATGAAATLMRLASTLTHVPSHATLRASVRGALTLLGSAYFDKPFGMQARLAAATDGPRDGSLAGMLGRAVHVALAARTSTWRRRRHVVVARDVALAEDLPSPE